MADDQKELQATMTLISYGGDARSDSFEAINLASEKNFEAAEKKLQAADESLKVAHNKQTEMLTSEAQGINKNVSLLTVHGQDHLMNALTCRDLAGVIVKLYKKMYELDDKKD